MASRGGFESDPSRVVAGHKAAMNNPNVSDEAKEHSREIVEEMEQQPEEVHYPMKEEKDDMRVNAGLKGSIDPNVSSEAKERAEETLREKGAI